MNTKVTVLMSVFNGESWLSDSIKSVLCQTYSNFEFIIVDDGSSDRSSEIIRCFASHDSRIKLYTKPNTGLTDSLNYGLHRATGDWIARIDADDCYTPDKLQLQMAYIEANPTVILVGTGLVFIDESGKQHQVHAYPSSHKQLLFRLAHSAPFFAHSSALFKTSVARSLRGYRPRFHRSQDRDLWLRLAEVGRISCLPQPLVLIRKHARQVSHDMSGKRQLTDSYVAMISFWLRAMNEEDPSLYATDLSFSNFRTWVHHMLQEHGIFDQDLVINHFKKQYQSVDQRFAKALILVFFILRRPLYAYRFFRDRHWGSQLPRQLARLWLQT